MIVYKFGGASVKDAKNIENVKSIIESTDTNDLIVVVSAMGKITNALEKVVDLYFEDNHASILEFNKIVQLHIDVANTLGIDIEKYKAEINEILVSVEWLLEEPAEDPYNYVYDQIVPMGEMLSSKLLAIYLNDSEIPANWIDVRDFIITDDLYRDANVDWSKTEQNIQSLISEKSNKKRIFITQGFSGSTPDNNTTTLGREGSDYTGSIFAYCSNASGLTIWKNVPGVLTGDPTIFENVTKLDRMSYMEAIEMTYYGAKVIHPKTIKPLQNKSIPLHVRSFINPTETGTTVCGDVIESYPPIVVIEDNQSLIHISTNDFSFVAEQHLKEIFTLIAKFRMKVNLMRNTAISFTICVQKNQDKIEKLITALETTFQLSVDHDLQLITIRHFNDVTIDALKAEKIVLFEEKLNAMVQMVVKPILK